MEATVDVEVKSTITNLQVDGMDEPEPVEVGDSITVSAKGVDGRASVTVTDADGDEVESLSNLGLDAADPDDDGSVAYTREINLPDDLAEGMYTVTVTIAGEPLGIEIEVVAAREAVTALNAHPLKRIVSLRAGQSQSLLQRMLARLLAVLR